MRTLRTVFISVASCALLAGHLSGQAKVLTESAVFKIIDDKPMIAVTV